jgi:hypothetical protein
MTYPVLILGNRSEHLVVGSASCIHRGLASSMSAACQHGISADATVPLVELWQLYLSRLRCISSRANQGTAAELTLALQTWVRYQSSLPAYQLMLVVDAHGKPGE